MTEMQKWLDKTIGRDSLRDIQRKTGISFSTLSRRLPNDLTAEQVIQLARGYDQPVVEALIASGHLTEADRLDASNSSALLEAKDEELADEVLRRMKQGGTHEEYFSAPVSNVIAADNRFSAAANLENDFTDAEQREYDAGRIAASHDESHVELSPDIP